MMKVVIINREQGRNVCCGYTAGKYILFACLDILVFSIYLKANKKKYVFQVEI